MIALVDCMAHPHSGWFFQKEKFGNQSCTIIICSLLTVGRLNDHLMDVDVYKNTRKYGSVSPHVNKRPKLWPKIITVYKKCCISLLNNTGLLTLSVWWCRWCFNAEASLSRNGRQTYLRLYRNLVTAFYLPLRASPEPQQNQSENLTVEPHSVIPHGL